VRAADSRGRHQAALWQALADGDIDLVATDHSPAPPAMKRLEDGDFVAAWGGIASLQLGLSAIWTGARRAASGSISSPGGCRKRPPRSLVWPERKGAIAPGHDADLVVFDLDAEWTCRSGAPRASPSRHPLRGHAPPRPRPHDAAAR
jgi:allantoinase